MIVALLSAEVALYVDINLYSTNKLSETVVDDATLEIIESKSLF